MPELTLQAKPFDEAIHFFRSKGVRLSPDGWRDVWAAENVRAFTVAKVTAMDVLEDIRGAVDQAIEKGVSLTRFRAELSETLARKGWMKYPGLEPAGEAALTPWRLELIYRNNVQSAYMSGRYKQMIENAHRRPFWLYDAVDDRRTRPTHAVHDGVVRRFDHPFWDVWMPPNGHLCRCSVRALSERQLRRRGLEEETQGTSWKPDEGFGYNPGQEFWQPDLTRFSPEGRRMLAGLAVGPPADMDALAGRLTRVRDGLRQTGIPTAGPDIRIVEHHRPKYYGYATYRTGEIALRDDVYASVGRVLRNGRVGSDADVGAVHTLIHEFGHLLGPVLDIIEYRTDRAYRALTQTVNDMWARHSAPQVLTALGIKYEQRLLSRLPETGVGEYQPLVDNMHRVFRASGIDEIEEKILFTELNLTADPETLSDRLWEEVQRRRPDAAVTADAHFGEVLLKSHRLQQLVEELGG